MALSEGNKADLNGVHSRKMELIGIIFEWTLLCRQECRSMSNHVSFYPIPEFTRPPTSWDDRKRSSFETILFFTAPETRGPEDRKARPGFGIADDVMANLAWSCPSGYVHTWDQWPSVEFLCWLIMICPDSDCWLQSIFEHIYNIYNIYNNIHMLLYNILYIAMYKFYNCIITSTYIHHQLMPWAWWHFRGACERCRYTRPPEGPASCWQWDTSWSPNVLIEQYNNHPGWNIRGALVPAHFISTNLGPYPNFLQNEQPPSITPNYKMKNQGPGAST